MAPSKISRSNPKERELGVQLTVPLPDVGPVRRFCSLGYEGPWDLTAAQGIPNLPTGSRGSGPWSSCPSPLSAAVSPPCRDPQRHRGCPGLWRGEFTTGYTGHGTRIRRKVSGSTKAAVIDKLRDLHHQLDQGVTSKAGYTHYTVRQAAEDWLATGLDGRSPKTVKKNQNVLGPILARHRRPQAPRPLGGRRQAGPSRDGRRILHRRGEHGTPRPQAHHPARRSRRPDHPQRRRPGRHPKGQQGRPSKSLTLDQAAAVITAARTLPVMELRPGLKDVRRPAELMHAYIVLSLLAGIRTEEARALHWTHVDLDGDPAASPPSPPHVAVWRSVRAHGDTKTERSRRTLGLPAAAVQALHAWSESQAGERLAAGDDWQDTGLVFTTHHGAALDAANVRKMFKRVTTAAGIGDGWTPRELRTSFVSLLSHHGVSIEEIARLVGHASTRATEIVYRRELRPVITTGAEIMDQLFKGN
jgi:integrase